MRDSMQAASTTIKPFDFHMRDYWEDTDAGGVVFYANYLKFFERARTEWLRSMGIGQRALQEEKGLVFVVTDTRLRYRQPARLDDELRVSAALGAGGLAGRATMTIEQAAWRGDTLLVDSTIGLACVDAGTFRPRRIPNILLDALAAQHRPAQALTREP